MDWPICCMVLTTLQELRVRAYLDLLQETDSRDTPAEPPGPDGLAGPQDGNDDPDGPDGPGGNGGPQGGPGGGPGGNGGPAGGPAGTGSNGIACQPRRGTGPSVAALVNITVPLATLLGLSATRGEAAGFGLLDAQTVQDLAAAAARHPNTRWCLTALQPDGTAAAHGCAAGRHPAPPGAANAVATCENRLGPAPRPAPAPRTTCKACRSRWTRSPAAAATTRTPRPGTGPAASCST